jgi:uncharacterized protein YcbX
VADFVENNWLRQTMVVGHDVRLRLIDPSPRCVVTMVAHGDLPQDPGILRTISRHNTTTRVALAPGVVLSAVTGIYADVAQEGVVQKDSLAYLEESS